MTPDDTSLTQAFLEDHRHLTVGFSEILKALEEGDLKQAVRIAEKIDRAVGSHIEFEEKILYPEIAKARGNEFVSRLYNEHRIGLEAVKKLMSCRGEAQLEPGSEVEIAKGLKTALDHAVSCGALLSYVSTFDEQKQDEMLKQLLELRQAARRWSDSNSSGG